MILETLKTLFDRDLAKLQVELEAYSDEALLWKTDAGIANSAGNLSLHLVGNLNAFIGAVLGNTGYVRDREAEFSRRGVPRVTLLEMIDQTRAMIPTTLDTLTANRLEATFPVKVFQQETSTGYMLVHLATHLAYHLGQVNYHRRLLDGGQPPS